MSDQAPAAAPDELARLRTENAQLLKRAEVAEEGRALWHAVFTGARDAMLLADDSHYVDANPSACALLRLPREELVGRVRDDWGSPGTDAPPQAHLFMTDETTVGFFSMALPDGTVREIEYNVSSNIFPHRHLSILRDVSERKRAERENVSQQELFQQVMDAIDDMVLVKGPASRLLWANKAFCNAYGMTPEQLRGMVDAPFVPPDLTAQYVKDDESVFVTGRPVNVPEELLTRHDGQVMRVHTVKSPIFDSHGKVIKAVAVCRDITEQRQIEMDLRQAQKLEAVGALASGIAHEINTPIQFIGDQTQFLKDAFNDLRPLGTAYGELIERVEAGVARAEDAVAVREAERGADVQFLREQVLVSLEAISDGTARVARLVQAMKEFGHPDRGEMRPADLNRALRTALILANSQIKYVADVETDFGELPEVPCWLGELNQVFLNVLVNAAHAIADAAQIPDNQNTASQNPNNQGAKIRGKIRVTTRRDGTDAVVSIADTGGGIPEEIRHRIFEPFFTTKEVGRGTGQGLAIARRIMTKHAGSLTFETATGVGTTFHVRLPMGEHP